MFERLHKRLGTAGMVIAVVALIATLGGTALAASGALTGKQKKEVEKIAKKYAGKNGTNGTNGAPGEKGAAGANGEKGAAGTNGTNGTSVTGVAATVGECANGGEKYTSSSGSIAVCNGAPGASPTVTESGASFGAGHCDGTAGGVGGSKFVVGATTTYACNGKNGTTGFTETLPAGKTETGTFTGIYNAEEEAASAISFAIPLATALEASKVHIAPNANCTGTVAAPTAPTGELCVYPGSGTGSVQAILKPSTGGQGADTTGAKVSLNGPEAFGLNGTFAVTG